MPFLERSSLQNAFQLTSAWLEVSAWGFRDISEGRERNYSVFKPQHQIGQIQAAAAKFPPLIFSTLSLVFTPLHLLPLSCCYGNSSADRPRGDESSGHWVLESGFFGWQLCESLSDSWCSPFFDSSTAGWGLQPLPPPPPSSYPLNQSLVFVLLMRNSLFAMRACMHARASPWWNGNGSDCLAWRCGGILPKVIIWLADGDDDPFD